MNIDEKSIGNDITFVSLGQGDVARHEIVFNPYFFDALGFRVFSNPDIKIVEHGLIDQASYPEWEYALEGKIDEIEKSGFLLSERLPEGLEKVVALTCKFCNMNVPKTGVYPQTEVHLLFLDQHDERNNFYSRAYIQAMMLQEKYLHGLSGKVNRTLMHNVFHIDGVKNLEKICPETFPALTLLQDGFKKDFNLSIDLFKIWNAHYSQFWEPNPFIGYLGVIYAFRKRNLGFEGLEFDGEGFATAEQIVRNAEKERDEIERTLYESSCVLA